MPSGVTNDPQIAQKHYQTAQALHRQGRPSEAEPHYRAALLAYPDHPGILHFLGLVCVQSKRYEEGAGYLRRALRAAPEDAAIHSNLGLALLLLGRNEEAVGELERALKFKPDFADALGHLGSALGALGRHDKALHCLERALALQPGRASAHNNYGTALSALGRDEEALAHFRKAVTIDPKYAGAYNNIGKSLESLNRPVEAIEAFERALAVDPGFAMANIGIGNAMMCLGRIEDARIAYERTLAANPRLLACHSALAQIKTFHDGDPQIAALEDVAKDETSLSDKDKVNLHFTLYKVYADLERHELAFAHLEKGNKFKRAFTLYDETKEIGVLRDMAAIFTRELIEAKRGTGDPSDVPVFVFGMPRSGTTLVEQILASHPHVFGAGELGSFGSAVAGGYELKPLPFDTAKLTGEDMCRLGERYLAQVLPKAPQAKRITDKMLGNIRFAGLIHLVLPNAYMIHVRRDPIDTCFSCYSALFQNSLRYIYDLGELGRYYAAYEVLMAHWRAVLPEGAMLEVQYEDLVDDFEVQARRIVEFCGLDWDERCLAFYKTERSVHTASAAQVRQPLYRSSIGRWRHYKEQLRPLLDVLDVKADTAHP
jgi:tetratricopeptide (TPR) repeat protein